MKTKYISMLCVVLSTFCVFLNAQKTSLGGTAIPKTYAFNNKQLVLNGSAIRQKIIFDIYVGSLYLPTKSANGSQIINADSDMGFRIKILSGLLSSDKMKSGVKESFAKVAKQYPVTPAVFAQFLSLFNAKIRKGDEFFFGYNSSEGLVVYKNGAIVNIIKSLSLKKALYATWLSNAISTEFTSNILKGN